MHGKTIRKFSLLFMIIFVYNCIATGWIIRGLNPGKGKRFCFLITFHTAPGAHLSLYWMCTGVTSSAVRWSGPGVNRSSPSRAEVKIEWICTSVPPIHLHYVARENSTIRCRKMYSYDAKGCRIFSGFTARIVWCWSENQSPYFWKPCIRMLSLCRYVVSQATAEAVFWEYRIQQWIVHGSKLKQLRSGCNVVGFFFHGKARHSD